MKIHIEHFASSYSITFHTEDSEYDVENFTSLDAALAYAQEEIDVRCQAVFASIWDSNTGEVYASCSWDNESIPEEDYGAWDDWGYNEDEGFDPYMGEYTWDC